VALVFDCDLEIRHRYIESPKPHRMKAVFLNESDIAVHQELL
jgi:hypothetical protein